MSQNRRKSYATHPELYAFCLFLPPRAAEHNTFLRLAVLCFCCCEKFIAIKLEEIKVKLEVGRE